MNIQSIQIGGIHRRNKLVRTLELNERDAVFEEAIGTHRGIARGTIQKIATGISCRIRMPFEIDSILRAGIGINAMVHRIGRSARGGEYWLRGRNRGDRRRATAYSKNCRNDRAMMY